MSRTGEGKDTLDIKFKTFHDYQHQSTVSTRHQLGSGGRLVEITWLHGRTL